MKLPNFFIVGAPKAGTTSLYHYLDQHPQIYMSPVKEPNYFASEIRPERFSPELQDRVRRDQQAMQDYLAGPMSEKRFGAVGLEWAEYVKLFAQATSETALGEASVCYLWSESAARNIYSMASSAKIVMILRDPAERAFSQYMQWVTKGVIQESFRGQVEKALEHRGDQFQLMRPFLEFGLYSGQVKRYLDIFPRENLHIVFYEHYRNNAGDMLTDLFRFLDVDTSVKPDTSAKHLVGRVPASSIDPCDRAYLIDYYRDDVQRLSALLDRDLTHWLN
jgi:sulfotransferase family protein